MRNTLFILFLGLSNLIGYAQENAIPLQVDGTFVIALSSSKKGFTSTESIQVPNEILLKSKAIDDRIHWLIEKHENIAAVSTRDGVNFQIIRQWDFENQIIETSAFFAKPVFFLSQPQKKYVVVKKQNIDEAYFALSYFQIAKSFIGAYPNLDFDALVILNNRVEYIKF